MELELMDPTADYCKHMAGIYNKFRKRSNCIWYRVFRGFGLTSREAFSCARDCTQSSLGTIDLSVNFDGPMLS